MLVNLLQISIIKSLANALLKYHDLSEPHLNEFQRHVYGELKDHLSNKIDYSNNTANTYLAYPVLTLDKFSGTNPDHKDESFFLLTEKKKEVCSLRRTC